MTKAAEDPPLTKESSICSECKIDTSPFLHYMKHRGLFRRVCTTCILRFNSQSFCPTCFSIYNPPTPLEFPTTPCSKCYSISHSTCISPDPCGKSYVCPLCSPQGTPFFQISERKVIDKGAAAALLAAARISYDSMSRAALVAKAEVEKRGKEAWSTRKRAREAIQHVEVVEEENFSKGAKGVVGSEFGRVRVENSSAVLASLNAVELNDKEVKGQEGKVGLGVSGGGGRAPVVDVKPVVVSGPFVQNNHPRDGNGGSC